MKILIVEDDVMPAHYLRDLLTTNGHEVVAIVDRGARAIEAAEAQSPDLILMDVMLKDAISGAEAAERIHQKNPELLIVFLTAYSDQEMIDYAVRSAAFSYLLKPYRDNEILATLSLAASQLEAVKQDAITAIERRQDRIALVGGYSYSLVHKRLYHQEQEVPLAQKELRLINTLCQNQRVTLEIDVLIRQIWGEPKGGQILRSLIHRIRGKTTPALIQNTSRFGYRIGLASFRSSTDPATSQ